MNKRPRTNVHQESGDALLAEVARAYYERDQTQARIAQQFGISRPQVSRYLQAARDRGIVQIRVVLPESRDTEAEEQLRARFRNLRDVVVVSSSLPTGPIVRARVATAAARVIERLVEPTTTICFGAGRTLAEVVRQLKPRRVAGITVVQAMGNAGHGGLDIDYNAIADAAASAFGGQVFQINAPAILGPGTEAASLERSTATIREALAKARSADVYVVGLGSPSGDVIYVQAGLMTVAEYDEMTNGGAVGDICGNYYDLRGTPCESPFADRLVGVRLDDLRRGRYSVGCAAGVEKVPTILGALNGGFMNVLVTDELTARGVLALAGETGPQSNAEPGPDQAATGAPTKRK